METYSDNWNACLLFRNKQLTKQLKNYQEASVLADCSSSLLLAMSIPIITVSFHIHLLFL